MLNAKESYVQFVDQPAPEFTLKDADRRSIALKDLRGKVVVLYFICASCPDVCPLQSEKLATIQAQIQSNADARHRAVHRHNHRPGAQYLESY